MRALLMVSLLLGVNAFANDGGIAAIKVSEIKMREMKNGEIKKRLSDPHYSIVFKGEEAVKLQKILPPTASVVTAMQPELKDEFEKTFRTLAIYNLKSQGVSAKALVISCSDGDLDTSGNKIKIVKKAQTECEISINAEADPTDGFGDMQVFEPKTCNP